MFTEEQWERLQQFSAHKEEKEYTRGEILTGVFCGIVLAYLVTRVLF